jgi:alpha-glucosidase
MRSSMVWAGAAVVSLVLAWAAAPGRAEPAVLRSPDGSNALIVERRDGELTYRVERFGRPLIARSRLGVDLACGRPLAGNLELAGVAHDRHDGRWTQPWGEKKTIRNHYHQMRVTLVEPGEKPRRMVLAFRAYDDGVALRYEWPRQPHLQDFVITRERTEFAFPGDPQAWWIPAFGEHRYEYRYRRSPVSGLGRVHTPLTLETADGRFLSIHEAALTDYASMTLAGRAGARLEAELVPWSDGTKVRATAPHVSPWRSIQIADRAGGLITSYLILNLNEPSRIADTSWIQPEKYVGIWWAMHIRRATWGQGPRHGATTERAKTLIDFAAAHGIPGVLIEGWNVGWNGPWRGDGRCFDFTQAYDDFDIQAVVDYARRRGVHLIGHHETGGGVQHYERQLDAAFAFYDRLGIKRIKTGYVDWAQGLDRVDDQGRLHREWHHGQYMVRHYRRVVERAAAAGIMLDVHEPIKPTGIRRTWPNMLTREGARGQEYNAWADDGGNPPEHTTILPFTRLLAGPMDFTPGIFDLLLDHRPHNRVNTTLAKQLALYVVIYSPLQMAADLPENYADHLDAFRFIEQVPVDWADTRVLHARIGDYVTIVRRRRGGADWYLGAVSDEQGRILDTRLSFLTPGRRYRATIYRDADYADWKTDPTAYTIERRTVTAADRLQLRLAPGGGQAIRFTPLDD